MPTYQQSLAEALNKKSEWAAEATTMFLDALSNEAQQLDAFRTRQSLAKNGAQFPINTTTVDELDQALNALNNGDSSVYSRTKNDARRRLQITEEPDYNLVNTITPYMTLSTKLTYDAACFHSCMMIIYDEQRNLASTFNELKEQFPEEEEDLIRKQQGMEQILKIAITNQIIRLEYQKIIDQITEDRELPEYLKEDLNNPSVTLEQNSSVDLIAVRNKIIELHINYVEKKAQAQKLIGDYQKSKEDLNDFLKKTTIPLTLRTEGKDLLDILCKTETKQALAIIAQEGSTSIYIFLNQATREIAKLKSACAHAHTALKFILARDDIDESLKQQGRIVLSFYDKAQADGVSLDELSYLADQLAQENIAIHNKQIQKMYSEAKQNLQALVENAYVPNRLKSQAITLLNLILKLDDKSNANALILALNNEIKTIKHQMQQIQRACADKVASLNNLLIGVFIREDLKIKGRALLKNYRECEANNMPLEQLEKLAQALHAEHGAIEKQEQILRQQEQLKEQHEKKTKEIQNLLNNASIPDDYKTQAKALLADAGTTYVQLIAAHTALKERIESTVRTHITLASQFTALLSNPVYSEVFKTTGKTKLSHYYALATNPQTSLATLLEHAQAMNKEKSVIENKHKIKYQYFGAVLLHISEMNRYGETLKNKGIGSKGNEVTKLAKTLETQIDEFIERASQKSVTREETQAFKSEFERALHAQDNLMNTHRTLWKPIVTNILIAFTGIGLLALIARGIYLAVQGGELPPLNHALFFARTNSECRIEAIDKAAHTLLEPIWIAQP